MLSKGYGRWIAAGCLGAAAPSGLAQTCDDNSGNSPYVCVDWSQANDPIEGQNFDFDFQTDPDNPGVTFKDGDSGWVVWSQVSSGNSTPANLGDVTINPSSATENFQVQIKNGSGAGAANVAKFDLTAGGGWTGYSNITGGSITGNLIGDLKAKKSGSSGGAVTFTIGGNMTGDITADSIAAGGLTICGDMVGGIDIETIAAGNLTIEGDYGDGAILYALVVETLDSAIVKIGERAMKTYIDINYLAGTAQLEVGYMLGGSDPTESSVLVSLGTGETTQGVPPNAVIDLSKLALTEATQVNIGGGTSPLQGTVIIGEIHGVGQIVMGALSGVLEIKRGVTNYTNAFNIDLTYEWTGVIKINTDRADADFKGQLDTRYAPTSNGLFELFANNSNAYGDLRGSLSFGGDGTFGSNAGIIIHGDVIGTDLDGDESILIRDDIEGAIEIKGDVLDSAKIIVNAPLSGDIKIDGDVEDGSLIEIQSLTSTGRILIDGECDADIKVQRGTEADSLIRMTEGLGADGKIRINSSFGEYDAEGDIRVGPASQGQRA